MVFFWLTGKLLNTLNALYVMKVFAGAKTVPRNQANKNTPHKNNDFTPFFSMKSIENTIKHAIPIS